ncbi:hypothetical protein D3C87_1150810 [compost metagenome]
MRTDLLPAHSALALGRSQPSRREQAAEVGVALAILDEQNDPGAIVHCDLGADDKVQAHLLSTLVGPYDPIDSIPVRQSQRTEAKACGLVDQLLGVTRALEEGKVTFAPEGHGHGLPKKSRLGGTTGVAPGRSRPRATRLRSSR